jgi:peptidoglycan/xylan/chitin deacetylase (PgdA/CDA1 family)
MKLSRLPARRHLEIRQYSFVSLASFVVKSRPMVRGFPWARVLLAVAIAGAGVAWMLPWWFAAADALLVLACVGLGVFVQGAGLFARPILAVAPERASGKLALTFDDGPDPEHTRKVMDVLEAGGHRGTFFVIGRRAAEQRELLAEMRARGHALGNHSWHHAHTTPFLAPKKLAEDLKRAQELLGSPRWFRAPVGILSPRVVEAARLAGVELVGWSGNARDGVAATVEAAAARLRPQLVPGAILVLHDAAERGDRKPIAAEVLQKILKEMNDRGLKSVTLDELLMPLAGAE